MQQVPQALLHRIVFSYPLSITPQATIAAETPQIETAEASITPNSSSSFSKRESFMEKNQTTITTITACKIPGRLACTISLNKMLEPKITRPVFIKNSERAASFNQLGVWAKLPTESPITSAK